MATFTSLGIGSGLDLNTMLKQLVALERRPIEQLQTAATRLQTKVSAVGQVKSLVAAVQDAANALTGTALWKASVATSGNDGVVATLGGSTAAEGSYAVTVSKLAAPQTLASTSAFAAADAPVGEGTLTIDFGTWNAGTTAFTPDGAVAPIALAVSAADTVQSLRDKINALGAGVTASIVTDALGTRVALRSSVTGEAHGFRVSVVDADGNPTDAAGLSRLAFDPPAGANGMAYSQAAANASAVINGIAVASSGNELSGVVEGLTLRLRGTSATPVSVDVSADREGVRKAVQRMADAYNALATYVGQQTAYDAATEVAGTLQGDSTMSGLVRRLRGVFNDISGASAALPRLSDIGLQLQRDGTVAVNAAKLDSALADLGELRKALSNSDALDSSKVGFARRFAGLAGELLGVDGALTTRHSGLQSQISKNSEQQGRLEDRVERFQQRMIAQFTAMDTQLSKLTALNSYVTQQLAALTQARKDR